MEFHYYIEKKLCIYYNDNSDCCITLKREKKYFDYYHDFITNTNTQKSNLTKWEKTRKHSLIPKAPPFVIYTNNSFISEDLSYKYQTIIEIVMNNNDDKKWKDVKDIIIFEERYEIN